MANNRMYLVHTPTGQAAHIASLSGRWGAKPEAAGLINQFFDCPYIEWDQEPLHYMVVLESQIEQLVRYPFSVWVKLRTGLPQVDPDLMCEDCGKFCGIYCGQENANG